MIITLTCPTCGKQFVLDHTGNLAYQIYCPGTKSNSVHHIEVKNFQGAPLGVAPTGEEFAL